MTDLTPVVRVIVTDPHPVVMAGIRAFLRLDKTVRVVGECKDLWHLLPMCDQLRPDVVLLGHALDDQGWKVLSRGRSERTAKFHMLLMASDGSSDLLTRAMRGGCRGIYNKSDRLEDLPEAIRAICEGRMWFRDGETHQLIESLLDGEQPAKPGLHARALTERQRQIISLVAKGLTNGRIAETLHVSQATVALDLTHIYKKLGVPDRLRLLIKVRESAEADAWTAASVSSERAAGETRAFA